MSNVVESQVWPIPEGPVGIGGWLILPIIGFIGTMILTGVNLLMAAKEVNGLAEIFNATSGPLTSLKVPMLASLIFGLLVMASAAYCLFLIFLKKQTVTAFATAHYLILAGSGLVDLWADAALQQAIPSATSDSSAIKDAVRGILIACIWIPYFRISKRVKNTFTNGGR